MSLESSRAFFQKLQTDSAFADELFNQGNEGRKKTISNAGFDFNTVELTQVISEVDAGEIRLIMSRKISQSCAGCCTLRSRY